MKKACIPPAMPPKVASGLVFDITSTLSILPSSIPKGKIKPNPTTQIRCSVSFGKRWAKIESARKKIAPDNKIGYPFFAVLLISS